MGQLMREREDEVFLSVEGVYAIAMWEGAVPEDGKVRCDLVGGDFRGRWSNKKK